MSAIGRLPYQAWRLAEGQPPAPAEVPQSGTRELPKPHINRQVDMISRSEISGAHGSGGVAVGLGGGQRPRRQPDIRCGSPIGGWVTNVRRFEPVHGANQAVWDTPHEKSHIFATAKSCPVRYEQSCVRRSVRGQTLEFTHSFSQVMSFHAPLNPRFRGWTLFVLPFLHSLVLSDTPMRASLVIL